MKDVHFRALGKSLPRSAVLYFADRSPTGLDQRGSGYPRYTGHLGGRAFVCRFEPWVMSLGEEAEGWLQAKSGVQSERSVRLESGGETCLLIVDCSLATTIRQVIQYS